ncbi:MAG TPA: hypothetical protein VFT39_15010 [Vicinamibacterales bacterium]|nr:hypothetical protein [Vicinamibacterales bacterium]
MSNWRGAMREAVERDEQDHLSPDEAQAMRRLVVAAVSDAAPERAAFPWMRRPVLVAATIVAIISVGVVTGLRWDLSNRSPQAPATEVASQASGTDATHAANVTSQNRQLQFMTAGGTRIIWVFNSELDLKATLR